MIQPHELRIGNMVNTIYGITTIIGVVDNGLEDYAMFIRTDSGHLHRTDGTKSTPIPLTEEWLIKAGFVGNEFKVFRLNDFKIGLNGDDIVHQQYTCIYKQAISVKVKHLHQLQNLYYCLCGEELKIEI